MRAIAQSSRRLAAMNIGGKDIALETGMESTEEMLLMPKQQMVFAARPAGIMPRGFIASVAGFGDWEAFGRITQAPVGESARTFCFWAFSGDAGHRGDRPCRIP
jgi:citrate lyase subunit beta / citryl-CoA lyase